MTTFSIDYNEDDNEYEYDDDNNKFSSDVIAKLMTTAATTNTAMATDSVNTKFMVVVSI